MESMFAVPPEVVRRSRRAGQAQGACSPTQKDQVEARDVSKQRVSQEIAGDHTGTAARFIQLVYTYASERHVDPAPLLGEALITYREARRESRSIGELKDAVHRKLARSAEYRGASINAIHDAYRGRSGIQDVLRALRRDVWLQISTVADAEALISRGVDPFDRYDR